MRRSSSSATSAPPASVSRSSRSSLPGHVASALVEAGAAFLLGCGRLRRLALITATASWVYPLLLAVVWMSAGLTVTSAALAWVAAETLRALRLLRQSAHGVGFARPRLRLLVDSIRFGIRAWVGSFARFLNFRIDQILMGLLASEAALGIYAVAVNASEVLLYLPAATATALLPAAARADPGQRGQQTLRAFRSAALVTIGAVVVAAILGPLLLPVVFGTAFRRFGRAVPLAAAGRARLRCDRGLLERARRLDVAGTVFARALRVTRRWRCAGPRADPTVRRHRRRGRCEHGVPGRRRRRPRRLRAPEPLRLERAFAAAPRRPRRAQGARSAPARRSLADCGAAIRTMIATIPATPTMTKFAASATFVSRVGFRFVRRRAPGSAVSPSAPGAWLIGVAGCPAGKPAARPATRRRRQGRR